MGDGGSQERAAREATHQNLALSNELYGIAKPALTGAMGYLTDAYGRGSTLDTDPKYAAMRTNFMDATGSLSGSFLDPKALGMSLSGRATGLSGIGAEQIGGAVDEMNKIRSLLAGQGLKTTGMAASAGGLETDALRYMYAGDDRASIIKGVAGAGAGIYGAGKQGGWWGQAANAAIQPGSSGSMYWQGFGSGMGT